MLVTTVLSIMIFHLRLNVLYCVSFALVFVALALYHNAVPSWMFCNGKKDQSDVKHPNDIKVVNGVKYVACNDDDNNGDDDDNNINNNNL